MQQLKIIWLQIARYDALLNLPGLDIQENREIFVQ